MSLAAAGAAAAEEKKEARSADEREDAGLRDQCSDGIDLGGNSGLAVQVLRSS